MLILFCDIVYDVHFKNNVTYLQILWLHCNLSKPYLISGAEKFRVPFILLYRHYIQKTAVCTDKPNTLQPIRCSIIEYVI